MTAPSLAPDLKGLIVKLNIGGHEGYLQMVDDPDGKLVVVMITLNKEGSTLSGVVRDLARAITLALEAGAPVEKIVYNFYGTTYEPSGFSQVGEENIHVSSISDAMAKAIAKRYGITLPPPAPE